MDNRIDRIRKQFNDRYIFIPDQWIEQQLSKNGLIDNFDTIYRQWLNTNLLDLDYSTINIPNQLPDLTVPSQKFNFNSTFQIVKLQDVSRPSPNDYCENLYKKKKDYDDDDENQQQENTRFNQMPKNRQLYFELFDGRNLFNAFEYENLNQLNLENCYLGAKLSINGEVDISFDTILLRSKNVRILGGLRLNMDLDNDDELGDQLRQQRI